MRLTTSKSKNAVSYYVIRSVRRDGKNSSEIVEKLGTETEIKEKYGCKDAVAWAKAHVEELNRTEKESNHKVLVPLHTDAIIPEGRQNCYSVGYLFLQQIYCQLGIPSICKAIAKDHSFDYDLDSILSRLIYGRVLYPSSKLSCLEQSKKLYEQPNFQLQHIYRALSVLADETDQIQAKLYENSKKVVNRSAGVLYYDCTNYFFEIEQEEGLKQYEMCKQHQPSPIVQMGLFMDKSGIPLAMCITAGNTNEQTTLKPLEQTIMRDFALSKFVVCTDADLSSNRSRMFNNWGERAFITTQSVKKLKGEMKDWALDPTGWSLEGSSQQYDIRQLEDNSDNAGKIFYKQRFIEGYDEERKIPFNQDLIVTYSLKYRNYQTSVRNRKIARAEELIAHNRTDMKTNQSDYKRLISKTHYTAEGEVANKAIFYLNKKEIAEEEKYDGFYAVCTNLDDDPSEIAKINRDRWEIEESFRIMKSEFEARPVYLKCDDRIRAHILTCFIALLVYRILEKKLGNNYTCHHIISTLRDMDLTKLGDKGYTPAYTRTQLTDALHQAAGFRTDYELITEGSMKGICRRSKGL